MIAPVLDRGKPASTPPTFLQGSSEDALVLAKHRGGGGLQRDVQAPGDQHPDGG
jgi:hypothetical protein